MWTRLSIRLRRTGKRVQGGIGLKSLSSTKVSALFLHRPDDTCPLVSMVDGELFDKLAKIGSRIRRCIEPFGGIQVRIDLNVPIGLLY